MNMRAAVFFIVLARHVRPFSPPPPPNMRLQKESTQHNLFVPFSLWFWCLGMEVLGTESVPPSLSLSLSLFLSQVGTLDGPNLLVHGQPNDPTYSGIL